MEAAITDGEFARFQRWIFEAAGIHLPDAKKALVESRLACRLKARELSNYGDYFKVLVTGDDRLERQTAIDLITTNETYFFREPKHFEFLRSHVAAHDKPGRLWRAWSAASSSGGDAAAATSLRTASSARKASSRTRVRASISGSGPEVWEQASRSLARAGATREAQSERGEDEEEEEVEVDNDGGGIEGAAAP